MDIMASEIKLTTKKKQRSPFVTAVLYLYYCILINRAISGL